MITKIILSKDLTLNTLQQKEQFLLQQMKLCYMFSIHGV